MGLFACKPENPHVRDRVRLCDGLKPLFGSTVAAGGNGRFVFILGEKRVRSLSHHNELTTFKMDYIDLLRSTRTRFECVGGFCNFGILVGFYALDERTAVLVDFNEAEHTMRQRLITIDPETGRTYAWLDRGYRLNVQALFFIGRTAVSEDLAVTIAPSISGRLSPFAMVYPKHPLDTTTPLINISHMLVEASARIRAADREAAGAIADRVNLSAWDAPLFLSPTKLGFFTDRSGMLTVDPSLIVSCDIQTGGISIDRCKADGRTNFPYAADGTHPYDCRSYTASHSQLGLIVSHRCAAKSWRRVVGGLTEKLSSWTFYVFLVLAENQWTGLSQRFLGVSIFLGLLKYKILRPPGARIGLMDTATMQWREQEGAADLSHLATMKTSTFHDGHTLIYDRVTEKRIGTREIGRNSEIEPMEEIRILANPGKVSSLQTLSEMGIRRRNLNTKALNEIADRI
ncbi:hypothetical protein PFISCL1PPCAC_923 [Pristionchus fissidentatus]|uniref:Uncharacterized protein n=1 Tax=Pristionchus fissidentatus TaxID=1538716 RepID=A0AAV5UR48_9BILA|nr:hypothetical protein PFISCL1PPCAC_923 [Pristionchus fissidentatus]